jgi:hypothetical protein
MTICTLVRIKTSMDGFCSEEGIQAEGGEHTEAETLPNEKE